MKKKLSEQIQALEDRLAERDRYADLPQPRILHGDQAQLVCAQVLDASVQVTTATERALARYIIDLIGDGKPVASK